MKASYVKLNRDIWANRDFVELQPTTQRAYLMLISQGDLSVAGVIPMTCGRWAYLSTATTATDVRADLERLAAANFIVIDESTEELWVRSYIKHDRGFTNPNGMIALHRAAERIVSPQLRAMVWQEIERAKGATEAPTEGAYEGATEGATSPHKPAANSHKPKASSQQPGNVTGDPLSFLSADQQQAAAAALEKWFSARTSWPDVKDRRALMKRLRADAAEEWHSSLATYLKEHPEATPDELLFEVFHVNPSTMQKRAS
jgi:hypothetical protein